MVAPRGAGMTKRLAEKAAQALAVAGGVVVITFFLSRLVPGDPAVTLLGPRATPDAIASLRAEMGVDQPVVAQFVRYVGSLLRGDLGDSLARQGEAVGAIIAPALGVTFALIACTIAISTVVAVILGLIAAVTRRRSVDLAIRGFSMLALSIPSFFAGILLILLVSVHWGFAPAGGWPGEWPANFRFLWLPSLALSAYLVPVLLRSVRLNGRSVLSQQFIESAVTRGVGSIRLNLRHVLPNSALPLVTLIGFNVGALIGGAVVIEAVFGLPGVGTELVRAVARRDFPVVQGVALVAGVTVVVVSLITDTMYQLIDPRLRKPT